MDNLTLEMRACEKAGFGVSYGKWKATQPVVDVPKPQVSGKVRTCQYCGKQIVDKYNRNRRFCDDNCRSNARYKKVFCDKPQKSCEFCGMLFTPYRKTARFCSNNCSAVAYYYRKKEERQNEAKEAGHD